MQLKKIAVGLSGGVDSAFVAYLLKKDGWDVTGTILKLFQGTPPDYNPLSLIHAEKLCLALDIPHRVINAEKEFGERIIDYFIDSYLRGFTPNPCVFCNRFIKFGLLAEKIRDLGIEYLAMGHYAGVDKCRGRLLFKKAKDIKKSQEYFLALIPAAVLPRVIFPLSEYIKEDVIKEAQAAGILCKEQKESQDICFIENKDYAGFIEKKTVCRGHNEGEIRHVDGKLLGRHKGVHYFTYGQRTGLGIAWKEPLYVIGINGKSKVVTVGEIPYTYKKEFTVTGINWFDSPQNYTGIRVKARYNSPEYDCLIKLSAEKEEAKVFLVKEVNGIAPGQIAVFYYNDFVLGGGVISE